VDARVATVGSSSEVSSEKGRSADASLHLQEKKPSEADSLARETVVVEKGYSSEAALPDTPFMAHLHGKYPCLEDTVPIIDIDQWDIPRGKLSMVLGPVGCGKSLLLKALLGELDSFEGTVWVNSAGMAYCDQSPWIPNDTVRNIILGPCDWDEVWYRKVIKACALEQDIATWPEGENTTAGSQGISMSGGQKQRLVRTTIVSSTRLSTNDDFDALTRNQAIARAVYSRKGFLVLDDVLSSLDATTEDIVFTSLWGENGLLKGTQITTVLASSDGTNFSFQWFRASF
jgi:ABC-type transport system involved in cytochrome bd biosynthesis fused ATPase/permease subunit